MQKRDYSTPVVRDWGTVTQLTETGQTRPGSDLKNGSVAHSKGQ